MMNNMLATIHTPLKPELILSNTSEKKGILNATSVYTLRMRHMRVRLAGVLRKFLNFLNVSFNIV